MISGIFGKLSMPVKGIAARKCCKRISSTAELLTVQ